MSFHMVMVSPMTFPKNLHFFHQFYLIFYLFSRKKIPENVSRDHQQMLHMKNVDYHWKTDTLQEKERHIGFFQPLELLLTSIKWLLSESCFSPLGLKGLRNWGFSIRELMFLTYPFQSQAPAGRVLWNVCKKSIINWIFYYFFCLHVITIPKRLRPQASHQWISIVNCVFEVFTTSVFMPSDLERRLWKLSLKGRGEHGVFYFKCSIFTVLR